MTIKWNISVESADLNSFVPDGYVCIDVESASHNNEFNEIGKTLYAWSLARKDTSLITLMRFVSETANPSRVALYKGIWGIVEPWFSASAFQTKSANRWDIEETEGETIGRWLGAASLTERGAGELASQIAKGGQTAYLLVGSDRIIQDLDLISHLGRRADYQIPEWLDFASASIDAGYYPVKIFGAFGEKVSGFQIFCSSQRAHETKAWLSSYLSERP